MKKEKFFTGKGQVILLALISTLLWGSAFPCVKKGYEIFQIANGDMGSQMLFAGIRFFIAGLMTMAVSFFGEHKKYPKAAKREWPVAGIILVAFVQTFLQYFFYYVGMAHVTGVKGAILNGSTAFFCVIIARVFYKEKEKLTGGKLAGCLLGMAGVIIVNLSKGELRQGFCLLGEGFMLFSAISAAFGSLVNKEVARSMGPVSLCGGQLTIGSLMLIGLGLVLGGKLPLIEVGAAGWLLLLYMSFLSAAAFTLWTILLKYNPMGRITVYNFLIPVFGSILSARFLGEEMWNVYTLSALPLVCVGIYLVNRKK